MPIPLDAPLVHGIAMLHITELEKERGEMFPRHIREALEQRIHGAIDQAIQTTVEAIEAEREIV